MFFSRFPLAHHFCLVTVCLPLASAVWAADVSTNCPIVPQPKAYAELDWSISVLPNDRTAIILGAKASEPERYAAARLQTLVKRRFGRDLPIRNEDDVKGLDLAILLGQRSTNAWLDRMCQTHEIDLTKDTPGHDGFVIECIQDNDRQIVLIGGSNDRGVIYGQFAFFDLLRPSEKQASDEEESTIVFPAVSVCDWPSIAWRGRPHSVLYHHLVPGAMDAYARARLNYTDVRDDPRCKATLIFPARKASMGLPPGVPLDVPMIERHLREAHRRGMFVYGTVACSVAKQGHDAVLETYRRLIDLGVDGLWLSFDDTGADADSPELIRRVLQLGRKHSMTGRRLAVTPPLHSYEHIDKPFNRTGAAIEGFNDVEWFFTRVPCAEDLAKAQEIGITRRPAWWHNLVDVFSGGFLHNGAVATTMRLDDKPGYLNIQPMTAGWHRPSYERLRNADKYTHNVLLWGICNGWPEEYEMTVLGVWAWNPQSHDWPRTRAMAYADVFGPGQADVARQFDDTLAELKRLFHTPVWGWDRREQNGWPCHLKDPNDRAIALELVAGLELLSQKLQSSAPRQTVLPGTRLETVYLEPMRQTVVYARKMATLDYPEYSFAVDRKEVGELLDTGRRQEADALLEAKKHAIREKLQLVAKELAALKGIDLYLAKWERRCANLESFLAPVRKGHK